MAPKTKNTKAPKAKAAKASKAPKAKDKKPKLTPQELLELAVERVANASPPPRIPVPVDALFNEVSVVFLLRVVESSVNLDPDTGAPRVDEVTGKILVSPQSVKYQARNMMTALGIPTFNRYDEPLIRVQKSIYDALGMQPGDPGAELSATLYSCQHYLDVRAFGGVFSTGKEKMDGKTVRYSAGKIQGPFVIGWGQSVSPVDSYDRCIRTPVRVDDGKENMLGRNTGSPFALVRVAGTVKPHAAAKTGFTLADFYQVLDLIIEGYHLNKSAMRSNVEVVGCWVFEHSSPLGNAQFGELSDFIHVIEKNPDSDIPPRSLDDYEISISDDIPDTITVTDYFNEVWLVKLRTRVA